MQWTTGTDDDELVRDESSIKERNVDISNVVYSAGWGSVGEIKKNKPPLDIDTYTVVAWEEDVMSGQTVVGREVYFKVLYREGDDCADDAQGARNQVVDNTDDYKTFPSVTAHLNAYGKIVVDIVYQRREDSNDKWEVCHQRYNQDTVGNYDNFSYDSGVGITKLSDGNSTYDCIHPDIVFDSGADLVEFNRLHAVWEEHGQNYAWAIKYARANDESGLYWANLDLTLYNSELNERPRIDVGYDDTNWFG